MMRKSSGVKGVTMVAMAALAVLAVLGWASAIGPCVPCNNGDEQAVAIRFDNMMVDNMTTPGQNIPLPVVIRTCNDTQGDLCAGVPTPGYMPYVTCENEIPAGAVDFVMCFSSDVQYITYAANEDETLFWVNLVQFYPAPYGVQMYRTGFMQECQIKDDCPGVTNLCMNGPGYQPPYFCSVQGCVGC